MLRRRIYLDLLVFFFVYACSFCIAQPPTKAILLEAQQGNLCGYDCPLIPLPKIYGDYLYCFQSGDKLLIGEHQDWEIGLTKLASFQGRTLSLHYDNVHIWVKLFGSWQVHLSQYYFEYPFRNESCRAAAQMRSFEHGYTRPQPVPGPAIPVMRGKLVYGWAVCSSPFYESLSHCTVWDLRGNIRHKRIFQQLSESNSSSQTSIGNEAPEENFEVIHLKGGRTLQLYEFPLKARALGSN